MTKEFYAPSQLVNSQTERAAHILETRDLGWALYDLDFVKPADPKPECFHAQMANGVIYVPYPQLAGEISSSAVRNLELKE